MARLLPQLSSGLALALLGAVGAHAQVDYHVEEQVEKRTTEMVQERTNAQVQQQTLNRAESITTDRVVDTAVQPLINRMTDRLPAAQIAEDRVNDVITRTVERNLAQPPQGLPARLDILDQDGNTVFTEVSLAPKVRAVEREWLVLISAEEHSQLEADAPELMQFLATVKRFSATPDFLLTFSLPPELDSPEGMRELVPPHLRSVLFDRNHVYSAQNRKKKPTSETALKEHLPLQLPMAAACEAPVSIGMIDSPIDSEHPAFSGLLQRQALINHPLLDDFLVQDSAHGTQVAGVLGGEGAGLQPLLPQGRLYSAPVLYSRDARDSSQQAATTVSLLSALDWLMQVPELQVINMSLAGPPNSLLERMIQRASELDKIIVAAAGNEGPYSPPLFPAAYEPVLAVSAVNRDGSLYRWSNVGRHIDFSALGAGVPTTLDKGRFGEASGTSLAAPIVSAFLACALAEFKGDRQAALMALRENSLDLGAPGHDSLYGYGLLHPGLMLDDDE